VESGAGGVTVDGIKGLVDRTVILSTRLPAPVLASVPQYRDFRYQLTAVGAPAPTLHIAEEISNNRFLISGGSPNGRVSWQVTGVRRDAYAKTNPIVPQVPKEPENRGTYLYPRALGKDEALRIK
jgi:hypothetical protein